MWGVVIHSKWECGACSSTSSLTIFSSFNRSAQSALKEDVLSRQCMKKDCARMSGGHITSKVSSMKLCTRDKTGELENLAKLGMIIKSVTLLACRVSFPITSTLASRDSRAAALLLACLSWRKKTCILAVCADRTLDTVLGHRCQVAACHMLLPEANTMSCVVFEQTDLCKCLRAMSSSPLFGLSCSLLLGVHTPNSDPHRGAIHKDSQEAGVEGSARVERLVSQDKTLRFIWPWNARR